MEISRLNFDAGAFYQMINWFDSSKQVTKLPLTKDTPTDDIKNMVKSGIFRNDIILETDTSCYTQAVECHIKLVTETLAVVGQGTEQDGFIGFAL